MLTVCRAKGIDVSYPLDLVDSQVIRILLEERITQFSMLKYLLYSANIEDKARSSEFDVNFSMMFPWIQIEKEDQIKKEREELLKLREKVLSEG